MLLRVERALEPVLAAPPRYSVLYGAAPSWLGALWLFSAPRYNGKFLL
jgi:hypothetical protein